MIKNIPLGSVLVMVFDKVYGRHLLKDLIYTIFMNFMVRQKAMLILVREGFSANKNNNLLFDYS
jgi:hypothetical protein